MADAATARWRTGTAAGIFLLTFPLVFVNAGWVALWPSVTALAVVVLTRRVLTGLVAGATAGTVLLAGGDPLGAFVAFFAEHFLPLFGSSWKVGALVFTLTLGGFVALIEKGGGLAPLARWLLRSPQDAARRAQLGSFGLGFVCFFDGLANAMLVGRVMVPLARRCGVSRVKLAYIVDSTSAPVACLAFVSTWIAHQLAMIDQGFALAGIAERPNPYGVFFASLPYNFYGWFALFLLFLVIVRGWNIGPMRAFEREARANAGPAGHDEANAPALPTGPLHAAVLPVAVLVFGLLAGLYVSGAQARGEALLPLTWSGLANAFGAADAALVLVLASVAASLVAVAVYPRGGGRPPAGEAFLGGVQSLFAPVLILLAAWTLGSTLEALGAGPVLAGVVRESGLPAGLFPAAVFLTGGLVAFTTGTSWGTISLLMPLSIPVLHAYGLEPATFDTLLAATVGAVFSGAVFGDHCSPLSDTTIVSSIACGVEPHDHVRTQLPYALLAAAAAFGLGFVPLWIGLPGGWGLLLGALALGALVFLRTRGKTG